MDSSSSEAIPQRQCKACKNFRPETREFFVHKKGCRNGLDALCKTCRHEYKAIIYAKEHPSNDPVVPEGFKKCTVCTEVLPATLEYFHAAKKNLDGLRTPCKQCISKKRAHPRPAKEVVEVKPGCKYCPQCKRQKAATTEFFLPRKKTEDGLFKLCKECIDSNWRKAHPDARHTIEGNKRCDICRQNIPADPEHFHALKSEKDGFSRICKKCRAKVRKEQRLQHIDEARAYERAIHRKNAEYYRRYHEVNHERIKARGRQHYYDRLDYYKEYGKAYRKTHPEGRRARDRNRRARKRALGGVLTQHDIQQQFQRQRGKCYYCHTKIHLTMNGKAGYHADHIIPISREGSSNDINNIVLTCPTCNLKKGNKLPHEWPEGNRLL